jgi:hypothetical protein
MVRMLVGEENAGEVSYGQAALCQTFAYACGADTGVYQQVGATAGNDGGIALAAAGE